MSADVSADVLVVAEQLRRRVPGGIGTYVRGLVAGLTELGRTPPLLASAVRGEDPLRALTPDLRTVPLPAPVLTRLWDRHLLGPRGDYDVLHATSFSMPPTRRPLTVVVHDLGWRPFPDALPPRGRAWHEAALQRAVREAARLVVPSRQTADDLVADGVAASRIEVVPHGHDHLPPSDEAATDAVLARVGLAPDATFLLAVGTQEPRKNLPRLLEAYAAVRPRLPEPWPLVVVGPVGWGAHLQPVEGTLIVSDATLTEVAGLYDRCRLLAYVPLLEGYGLPVIEAMSRRAPVVATAVPSAGEAARQVEALDVEGIAAGLLEVATDDALRADLVERGSAHAARTTWRAAAARHVEVWDSVAATA